MGLAPAAPERGRWGRETLTELGCLIKPRSGEIKVSNIDSLITQGVNGMAIFSFNQQGAITAANKCKAAGIPLVTVDNCGQALASGSDIVAAVDFDWKAMGKNYADYIAEHFPAKKVALITGILEHLPVQMVTGAMKERMQELGKNEIVAVRAGQK